MEFTSADYVKLMNAILGFSMAKNTESVENNILKTNSFVTNKFPLHSENLVIRKYDKIKDKKTLKIWFNDEKSKLFLLSRTTSEDLELRNISDDKRNLIGVITLKDNIPIGLLAFLHIDSKNKKAEMRKLIGKTKYRGKGFAKEASRLWIKYGTESLGLNKIYINTLEANIKNISLNRQLGFKIEGVLKKECFINGKEHDVFRMAYYKS